jgi:hypothetical protein
MNPSASSRNLLVAAAACAAVPAVVLGSYLFSVANDDDPARYVQQVSAAHTRFVAGGLLLTVGTFLLVPAALALMRLAGPRGRVVAVTGGVLSGIAATVLGAGYLLITLVMGFLTPAHAVLATQVQRIAGSSTLGALPFLFAPLLVIGLVITAVGLLLGGIRPIWLPIVLAVGAVLLHFAPDSTLGSLLHAPVVLAIAGLAIGSARRSLTPVEEPVLVAR